MLFYAIARGNSTGIYKTSQSAMKQIKGHPSPLYRVFNNISDAEDFLAQYTSTDKCISIPTDRNVDTKKVPIKGRSVAYVLSESHKGVHYYAYTIKTPSSKPINRKALVTISKTSIAQFESTIAAITEILDTIEDQNVTIYTNCPNIIRIYDSSVPIWRSCNWEVSNTCPEFEIMKKLCEKIGNRNITITKPPENSKSNLIYLNSIIRNDD